MNERPDELGGFLSEVSEILEHDVAAGEIQPDFEAMLARAAALGRTEAGPAPAPASQVPEPDQALDGFVSEVATHLQVGDDAVPDFLAVVSRAHAMAPDVIPRSAVEEVGGYAPIIALRDVGRLKTGQNDPALDTFVGEVRGHVDHELVREETAADAAANDTNDTARRGGFSLALAAGLVLALGLGAGLATVFDLGGGLWSPEKDAPTEAMLSPRPSATQESELASDSSKEQAAPPPTEVVPAPEPDTTALDTPVKTPVVAPDQRPRTRSKPSAKTPSRRERLAALEREANAAWQARKLDDAERAFRKIISIDGHGTWGESAYGELFTLQRQRGRSSVALWKVYLKHFPTGRFADDARAGLCRRAEDDSKAACWSAYLETMPRGSFRAQAQHELNNASGAPTP